LACVVTRCLARSCAAAWSQPGKEEGREGREGGEWEGRGRDGTGREGRGKGWGGEKGKERAREGRRGGEGEGREQNHVTVREQNHVTKGSRDHGRGTLRRAPPMTSSVRGTVTEILGMPAGSTVRPAHPLGARRLGRAGIVAGSDDAAAAVARARV
jgi:hypothetical protein